MSRSIFAGVCDQCFDPVFKKSSKSFVREHKRCGSVVDDPREFVAQNLHNACVRMSDMFLNDQMHRQCLVQVVSDKWFQPVDKYSQWAEKFSTDLDLLHVFCVALPELKEEMFQTMMDMAKMPVDVYRYLLENSGEAWAHVGPETGINAVGQGNFELAKYIMDQLDEIDQQDVMDLVWRAHGSEFLSCHPELKEKVIQAVDEVDPEDIEENPVVKTNIQNLLQKNYICAVDIWYKIQ